LRQSKGVEPAKEEIDEQITKLKSNIPSEQAVALSKLAYDLFGPWSNSKILANKHYFAQQGGVPLIVNLMASEECDEDERKLKGLAGSAAWNYSENTEFCEILYEAGCIPHFCNFLKSSELDLKNVAIGALWGFLEYENLREQIAKENGILQELVNMLKTPDTLNDYRDLVYQTIGCVQCSCCTASCRKQLVEAGVIPLLKKLSNPKSLNLSHNTSLLMVKYLSFICLSLICMDERYKTEIELLDALAYLPKFLEKHKPEEVRAIERKNGFLWKFTQCFYGLTESDNLTIHRFGTFCLANLSYLDLNRGLMTQEGLLDDIFCLQWSKDDITRKYASTIVKNFKAYLVPSLYALSKFTILQYNITNPTKKIIIPNK